MKKLSSSLIVLMLSSVTIAMELPYQTDSGQKPVLSTLSYSVETENPLLQTLMDMHQKVLEDIKKLPELYTKYQKSLHESKLAYETLEIDFKNTYKLELSQFQNDIDAIKEHAEANALELKTLQAQLSYKNITDSMAEAEKCLLPADTYQRLEKLDAVWLAAKAAARRFRDTSSDDILYAKEDTKNHFRRSKVEEIPGTYAEFQKLMELFAAHTGAQEKIEALKTELTQEMQLSAASLSAEVTTEGLEKRITNIQQELEVYNAQQQMLAEIEPSRQKMHTAYQAFRVHAQGLKEQLQAVQQLVEKSVQHEKDTTPILDQLAKIKSDVSQTMQSLEKNIDKKLIVGEGQNAIVVQFDNYGNPMDLETASRGMLELPVDITDQTNTDIAQGWSDFVLPLEDIGSDSAEYNFSRVVALLKEFKASQNFMKDQIVNAVINNLAPVVPAFSQIQSELLGNKRMYEDEFRDTARETADAILAVDLNEEVDLGVLDRGTLIRNGIEDLKLQNQDYQKNAINILNWQRAMEIFQDVKHEYALSASDYARESMTSEDQENKIFLKAFFDNQLLQKAAEIVLQDKWRGHWTGIKVAFNSVKEGISKSLETIGTTNAVLGDGKIGRQDRKITAHAAKIKPYSEALNVSIKYREMIEQVEKSLRQDSKPQEKISATPVSGAPGKAEVGPSPQPITGGVPLKVDIESAQEKTPLERFNELLGAIESTKSISQGQESAMARLLKDISQKDDKSAVRCKKQFEDLKQQLALPQPVHTKDEDEKPAAPQPIIESAPLEAEVALYKLGYLIEKFDVLLAHIGQENTLRGAQGNEMQKLITDISQLDTTTGQECTQKFEALKQRLNNHAQSAEADKKTTAQLNSEIEPVQDITAMDQCTQLLETLNQNNTITVEQELEMQRLLNQIRGENPNFVEAYTKQYALLKQELSNPVGPQIQAPHVQIVAQNPVPEGLPVGPQIQVPQSAGYETALIAGGAVAVVAGGYKIGQLFGNWAAKKVKTAPAKSWWHSVFKTPEQAKRSAWALTGVGVAAIGVGAKLVWGYSNAATTA
jgi:hypothetical protein